jgi:hypothetical protein
MAVTFDFASVQQPAWSWLRNGVDAVRHRLPVMRNFRNEISHLTHGKDSFRPILRIFWPNPACMPTLRQGGATRFTSRQKRDLVAGNGH